jgi:hypothetical protein
VKRVVLAAVAGLTVFVGVYAAAAAMGLSSYDLGAGNSSVTSCDNAFTIDALGYNGSGQITTVTVGDIDVDCFGGELTVQLTKADNSSAGGVGGPVTVTTAQATVTLASPANPSDVAHEVIIIVGP